MWCCDGPRPCISFMWPWLPAFMFNQNWFAFYTTYPTSFRLVHRPPGFGQVVFLIVSFAFLWCHEDSATSSRWEFVFSLQLVWATWLSAQPISLLVSLGHLTFWGKYQRDSTRTHCWHQVETKLGGVQNVAPSSCHNEEVPLSPSLQVINSRE